MKRNYKTYLLQTLFAIIILSSCGEKESEHEEEHGEEEVNPEEIELSKAQFDAAGIVLGTLEKKNLSDVVETNGYTRVPPQNMASASAFIGGIVKSIAVQDGQYVRQGQLLATLQSPDFIKMQEEYLSSKSNLAYLQLELERQRELNKENINAAKTLQKAESDYKIEESRQQSLKKQLQLLNINLTDIENGNLQSVISISAPISGFLTEVNVKLGAFAEPNKALFEIVDNSKMHVDLLIYEKDLFKVKVGQKVSFALTNLGNKIIEGEVYSIDQAFQSETKSVAVHAIIKENNTNLIPGMYVNALINIGNVLTDALPEEAIVSAEGREFIYILEAGHEDGQETIVEDQEDEEHEEHSEEEIHFRRIEVKTGVTQLGYTAVTPLEKIDVDAQIVIKGSFYILSAGAGESEHAH